MKRNANVTSKEIMEKGRKLQVKATAYCGSQKTAVGTWAKVKHTIAVDPKVIPYGAKIYIPELNFVGVAEDCGSAIKNQKIDIFMASYKEAMNWGIRTITIYVLD
jgi:3D (Asp-Asp-Asp) domain-containing protein